MALPEGNIAVVGAGLVGGSLLRAARAKGMDAVAYDPVAAPGLESTATLAQAVEHAKMVFLCMPLDRMKEVAEAILPVLPANAIVTDVGSAKGIVCAELDPLFQGKARFVGGHPMAGGEKYGFEASRADLFDGATVILTPTPFTDAEALGTVYGFWESLGARIEQMSPAEHDRRMAQISHLPHLAAAALATLPDEAALKVAGPGFRDATRIASGPADLWTGILSANRDETVRALDSLVERLRKAREALASGDKRALHDFLDRANEMRNKLSL